MMASLSSFVKLVKEFPTCKLFSRNCATSSILSSTILENKNTGNILKQMNETIDEFVCQYKPCKDFPELGAYLKKVSDYTLKGGEQLRYALTVNVYDMVEDPGFKDIETRKLAQITGFCWELLFITFLMSDDLEDSALMRHYEPCWYTLPDVGVKVITDVSLVRGLQHELFNKWFDQHPQRLVIGELFHKAYLDTATGQYLDRVSSQVQNNDYSNFTTERWEELINYKCGRCTFYPTVMSALLLTKRIDIDQIPRQVKEICLLCARIMSLKNEIYDVYADVDVLRKYGSDIREGKCTWLAATALQRMTPAQRSVFERNYGRAHAEHVSKIKELYDDLHIEEVFEKSQSQMIDQTKEMISRITDERLKKMMMDILICVTYDILA